MSRSTVPFLLVLVAGLGVGCSSTSSTTAPEAKTSANATPTPAPAKPDAHHAGHPLHNVHPIDSQIISGAVPEGDIAFDELKAMGIKTIISVDGASPDIARAEARGMRYVHIPITYSAVNDQERLEIARAVRDLPGPVFIHCHHGKHRSPAASAAVAVTLGKMTPEQGVAFMKNAGTAPSYEGLYACVLETKPAAAGELDRASNAFPALRKPEGIVAAMVDADLAFEHLGAIKAAGWKVPPDQPDLVPAAEAGRLVDLLRFSHEDPRSKAKGADYEKMLNDSVRIATELEDAIVAGAPAADLDKRLKLVDTSCKDCHAVYRNKR